MSYHKTSKSCKIVIDLETIVLVGEINGQFFWRERKEKLDNGE